MKVDFNNLRLNIIKDYNAIVGKLNDGIVTDPDMKRVVVPLNDLTRDFDNLRNGLVTLGCLYEEGRDDVRDVFKTSGMKLSVFNGDDDGS